MNLDERLLKLIELAFQKAEENKDEYITAEHLLFQFISSDIFEKFAKEHQILIADLKKEIEVYINENIDKINEKIVNLKKVIVL